MPRFATDELPHSKAGQALALADRIDTLTGIFAIEQKPTGAKDPLAVVRAIRVDIAQDEDAQDE